MKNLVLITDRFPYQSVTEVSFITPELKALAEKFDRVIIVPISKKGTERDIEKWPENVEISDTLVINPSLKNKLLGLGVDIITPFKDILRVKGYIRDAFAYTAYVGICLKNIKKLIKEYNLDINHTLFYTFWFNFTTAACTLIPGAKVITRTHGHDLFEERYFISPGWRRKSLERIKACYTVSKMAKRYISGKYPQFKDIIRLSRLGTIDRNNNIERKRLSRKVNNEGQQQIELLGISRLSPEKGMTRQFKHIIEFSKAYPEYSISYTHIGEGKERKVIEDMIQNLPTNLTINMLGEMHNDEVHHLLNSRYFHAILLLSYSEGGCPIALCEAISYGIPTIATDVGGITELLSTGGGWLLPSDSLDNEEFNNALQKVISNRDRLGMEARKKWEKEFNAERLRKDFAYQISSILD